MKTKNIFVGLSGGVDSSVAALLLKEGGYEVTGVFMKNWEEEDDTYCPAHFDLADALSVSEQLKIELLQVNFAEEYWQNVFSHFLTEYKAGRTPNPDILCNKEIKFKAFLQFAKQRGADAIATGHYAKIEQIAEQEWGLFKSMDLLKDQSYFLHALDQDQLSQSIFPLAELPKIKVRQIAKAAGFKNHAKKDSTGICFIGERKFKTFLNDFLPAKQGPIQTLEGKTIGQHDGLMFYTLGQRQGLKIGGIKNMRDAPWYVVDKDLNSNVLIVSQGNDCPALLCQALITKKIHWINGQPKNFPLSLSAKTRYRQPDQACMIHYDETHDHYRVEFIKAERAVTPGQYIVFYQNNQCLGGGVIESV